MQRRFRYRASWDHDLRRRVCQLSWWSLRNSVYKIQVYHAWPFIHMSIGPFVCPSIRSTIVACLSKLALSFTFFPAGDMLSLAFKCQFWNFFVQRVHSSIIHPSFHSLIHSPTHPSINPFILPSIQSVISVVCNHPVHSHFATLSLSHCPCLFSVETKRPAPYFVKPPVPWQALNSEQLAERYVSATVEYNNITDGAVKFIRKHTVDILGIM